MTSRRWLFGAAALAWLPATALAQPLAAPPLSCGTEAQVLDWTQNPWGGQGQPRQTQVNHTVAGVPFAFTATGDLDEFLTVGSGATRYESPGNTPFLSGGFAADQDAVILYADYDSNTSEVQIDMRVGEPGVGVGEVQIPIFDIDVPGNNGRNYRDRYTFEGSLGGVAVPLTSLTTNVTSTPSADGNSALGDVRNSANDSADGTAIARFASPVDRVYMRYGSGPGANSNPTVQFVAIHDIGFCRATDRADAPASYGTPTHLIESGVHIGSANPDHEPSARHSGDARGDDDEGSEAETAWPDLYPDETRTLTVPVSGAGGRLSAWVDWNRDGVFGTGERIATDVQDTDGDGQIDIDVDTPDRQRLGDTYARLRWSTETGLGPTDAAPDGEVEDALVTVTTPPPSNTGPAAPLPPLSCPGTGRVLDWDQLTWTEGDQTNTYTVGPTAFSFSKSYGNPNATDTRATEWPRTEVNKTGGYTPVPRTLRIGPKFQGTAGEATLRLDVGDQGVGVPGLQFEIFDVDARDSTARERVEVIGYLDGQRVAPPTVTTNANTVQEGPGVAGGVARGADDSADSNVGFTFDASIDRVEMTFGGRPDDSATNSRSVGLHDIAFCAPKDHGDAPASYGDAAHGLGSGLSIGDAPDGDPAARPTQNADGDDRAGTDDETDGLTLTLTAGRTATIAVPVTEPSPGTARLQAWIDWDGDGSFAQTGDQIAADRRDRDGDGTVTLTVPVPATAAAGRTIARFRWSSRTNLGPDGEAPDGEVEDHAVTIAAASARRVTGRVLVDDGRDGGTAHDGALNGGEAGRGGVTVTASREDGTLLATLTTDGEGRFAYDVPDGVAAGTRLVFETLPGEGFAAVSKASPNNPRTASNNRLTITAPGSGAKAILFGQVPGPTLTASRAQQVEPGGVATFTHRYAPGTAGEVALALGAPSGPTAPEFSGALILDADCDGQADSGEGPPPPSLAVLATDEVCLIVRVAADPSAQEGAAANLPLSAVLTRANGAGAATVSNDDQVTVSRDGGATLTKEVCNADRTSCDLATGVGFATRNGGAPGERLVYRIVFTAAGANAVRGVTITDTTPLYSSLVGETVRVASAPPALTCTVLPASGAQTDGYTGPVEWRCTGDLQPGAEGVAAFEVRIDP